MQVSFSNEERADLARMMMSLFDDWRISPDAQATLLGLEGKVKPRNMARYRQGTPLPEENEVLARVRHLLLIEEALHTSFPHNAAMATYWISTPNRLFDNQTPLDYMLNHGMAGIRRVHGHLDCTETWI